MPAAFYLPDRQKRNKKNTLTRSRFPSLKSTAQTPLYIPSNAPNSITEIHLPPNAIIAPPLTLQKSHPSPQISLASHKLKLIPHTPTHANPFSLSLSLSLSRSKIADFSESYLGSWGLILSSTTMAVTPSAREENVYMAKLAEQAERYEEMVEFMEKVSAAVESEELTVEERNLLSVAYKNVIGARRASWRIISSIEQKEESRGNEDHVSMIRDYRSKIESELSNICDGILKLLDTRLIPSAATGDSKVFYLKMKGDYHRYLAEFKTGSDRKEAAESTLTAYKSAQVRS